MSYLEAIGMRENSTSVSLLIQPSLDCFQHVDVPGIIHYAKSKNDKKTEDGSLTPKPSAIILYILKDIFFLLQVLSFTSTVLLFSIFNDFSR